MREIRQSGSEGREGRGKPMLRPSPYMNGFSLLAADYSLKVQFSPLHSTSETRK